MTAPQDRAGLVRVMAEAFFASRHRSIGNALEDALAAIEAASCRVVPVEATTRMKVGGWRAYHRYESVRDAYDASPFAPPHGDKS
jgi:hypothetical protein